ncbi:MAG: hypothetical protein ACLP9K_07880 [Nitrososphaerales archaeon]
MTQPIPSYAQEAYAILYNKFANGIFHSNYLGWYISNDMVKKTLHELETSGWVKRVGRGVYTCVSAEDVFKSLVAFKVPDLLQNSGRNFVYADASAAEIWTDFSYMQRGWEHSPYYINVLRNDLSHWVDYFRKYKVNVFVNCPETSLGEFVVVKPQTSLNSVLHNNFPVEPLEEVVRFCEQHVNSFEYHLAYLRAKFNITTTAAIDPRVSEEAAKAI